MRVLGIETSCDETGVALYCTGRGLLAQALHSQVELHERYGGVVPELASRDHVRRLLPLVEEVLARAGVARSELDAIAWTEGPGLAGALLVGAGVGAAMAFALGVPGIGIHHLEGHLLSPLLSSDKSAKLLGLGYPGGPQIAQLAAGGTAGRHALPRPMLHSDTLDFSFSGLKTAVATLVRRGLADDAARADLAAEIEAAIVEVLVAKSLAALRETGQRRLVVAGGVSANRRLRERLSTACIDAGARVHFPEPALCSDNGAMIALAGALRLQHAESDALPRGRAIGGFVVQPRWPLESLPAA